MKRIILIGEGQTEQEFCYNVLYPHFIELGIFIQNPTIKKTGGGIVPWQALKRQIELHLLQDPSAYVTTLIDYYGIYSHHEYPLWEKAEKLLDKNNRMETLEKGMLEDIPLKLQPRFIPYVQLHEFEGLLFNDILVFDYFFDKEDFLDYEYLNRTINKHPNPETINNGSDTAPSKRLAKILKEYYIKDKINNKVSYGNMLAQGIGLEKIRVKCPRFNSWIESLEKLKDK